MSFYSNAEVTIMPDGRTRVLDEPLTYKNDKYEITIPSGFDSDGASIPKIIWNVIGSPWCGKYIRPALLHDYLYRMNREGNQLYNKKESDLIFYNAMLECGVNKIKAKIIYYGVKFFGHSSWRAK